MSREHYHFSRKRNYFRSPKKSCVRLAKQPSSLGIVPVTKFVPSLLNQNFSEFDARICYSPSILPKQMQSQLTDIKNDEVTQITDLAGQSSLKAVRSCAFHK